MRSLKKVLKKRIGSSPFLSYWSSILYSKLLGLMAWRHRLAQIGNSHIALTAKITGWSSCKFGKGCGIGARTWINVNNRMKGKCSLSIGENTFIGQQNFFTAGKLISVGPYCLTGVSCSFIASSHLVKNPLVPYVATGTLDDDVILVGANCFFGYGAMVLGNVTIGHGSVIGAKSVVRQNIPPFSLAVGNPARVVKYYDFAIKEWVSGERPQEKCSEIPTEDEYIKTLLQSNRAPIQPLSAASSWLGDI